MDISIAQITADTPVNDVVGNRPMILKLAQEVFEQRRASVVRAFGQFQRSGDLARLIEAKRAGQFDFGATIFDGEKGTKYPTEVTAILAALDKSGSDAQVTEEDIALMYGAVNDETLNIARELLPKIVPTATPPAGDSQEGGQVQQEEQEAPKGKVVEFHKKATGAENVAKDQEEPRPGRAPREDFSRALDLLKEGLDRRFGQILGRIDSHFEQVFRNQAALNENLRTLANTFDPHMEFQELELELPEHGDGGEPAPRSQGGEGTQWSAPRPDDESEQQFEAQPETGGGEEDTSAHTDRGQAMPGEQKVNFTAESLKNMTLEDLRKAAASVGVAGAMTIGFPKVARRKIHVALGWPPE